MGGKWIDSWLYLSHMKVPDAVLLGAGDGFEFLAHRSGSFGVFVWAANYEMVPVSIGEVPSRFRRAAPGNGRLV